MKGMEDKKWKLCCNTTSDNPFCLSTNIMIIHYSTKVKIFNKKCINEYEQSENFNIRKCPNCNSVNHIKWGNYTRNVVYFKNGKKCENTIKIKRIRCNDCKTTHSIIPSYLVPYKVHILEYIIEVIKHKIIKNNSFKVAIKYNVSRQLVDYWNSCYKEHFTRICTILVNNNIKEVIKIINRDIYNFSNIYFKENNLIFMMYITSYYKGPILKWAPT